MIFMKQDLDRYEAWRQRWSGRPRATIQESKVEKLEDGTERMFAQAQAPGFRPERVVVIMPAPAPEEASP